MFKQIFSAGSDFAEKTIGNWAEKKLAKPDATPEDNKALSGVVGIAAGGAVKVASYFGLAVTAILVVSNPVSLAFAGYAAAGALFTGGIVFGSGMQEGGDKNLGLLRLGREIRKAALLGAADKVTNWGKSLKLPFGKAVTPAEAAPAVVVAPVVAKQPENKL